MDSYGMLLERKTSEPASATLVLLDLSKHMSAIRTSLLILTRSRVRMDNTIAQ